MNFPDALKRFRKAKNLTQRQIAASIGIIERSYQRYEYGEVKPSIDMVRRIADTYDISVDYLIGRIDNPKPITEASPSQNHLQKERGMNFSDALKRFRKTRGLTQKQIAKDVGFTERSYIRYEHGDATPSIETVRRIADTYDISVDYLIGRTDNPEINY